MLKEHIILRNRFSGLTAVAVRFVVFRLITRLGPIRAVVAAKIWLMVNVFEVSFRPAELAAAAFFARALQSSGNDCPVASDCERYLRLWQR